jgi:CheY-like chemotaxis protein
MPITVQAQGAAGGGTHDATRNGHAHRILVVDDNQDAALSLARILRSAGHEVCTLHDGATALEALRAFPARVLLLDIGMPGMDGYELARRVRDLPEGPTVLLIAISGYGTEEDLRRSKLAGFDHHLVKPVDPHHLKSLLASVRTGAADLTPA